MNKVIIVVVSIIFTACILFLIANIPIKINDKIKRKIQRNGLTHITETKNIDKIIDKNGYANLKVSTRANSYATFYRKAVFFFLGRPSKEKYVYNILGKGKEYSIIIIEPEDIDEKVMNNLY